MRQRTQCEQGAHEKLCQPKAKTHLESSILAFCGEVNSFPIVEGDRTEGLLVARLAATLLDVVKVLVEG